MNVMYVWVQVRKKIIIVKGIVCVCVRYEDVGNGGDIDREMYHAPDVADDARAALRRWWPDRHVVDMENVEMYTSRRFLNRQAPPTHTSLRRGRLGCARAATDGAAARSQTRCL